MNKITSKDLKNLSHKQQVQFALFCCYQIEHIWKNISKAVKCIEVTEKWLIGEASSEECKIAAYDACVAYAAYATYAAYAAYDAYAAAARAADAAAYAAAYVANAYVADAAAARAADAAAYAAAAADAAYAAAAADAADAYDAYAADAAAAYAAAGQQVIKEQWDWIEDTLQIDKNFEDIMLTI